MGFLQDAWNLPLQHKWYQALRSEIQVETEPVKVKAMRNMTRLWMGAGAVLTSYAALLTPPLNTDYEASPDEALHTTLLIEYLESESAHLGMVAVGVGIMAMRACSALHKEAVNRLEQLENHGD